MKMSKISGKIDALIRQRNELRSQGRFFEADKIRDKIQALGYLIIDNDSQTTVVKAKEQSHSSPKKSFLVVFGSGEIAPSAVKIYDYALDHLNKKEVKIAIITTPAGFQPNVKVVHEEIKEFFLKHLQNFHPQVELIYADTKNQANDQKLVSLLDPVDCIFIGPGSPTYAVKNLEDTFLYQKIIDKVKNGSTLFIASAASIAFSKFALPVYEIYKAGFPLYWEKGLDFYSCFLKPLTIIPHFNNNEGGRKNDTSRCFMGKKRFTELLRILPSEEEVWGIDEHTAVLINSKSNEILTMGKGKLHKVKIT